MPKGMGGKGGSKTKTVGGIRTPFTQSAVKIGGKR
jgi:hypothetical protein